MFRKEKGEKMSINVTEKAATAVKRFINEFRETNSELPEKVYLRLRIIGGGCSGFQNKLDIDTAVNEKLDETFEFHGVPVVIDKRSLMYLADAVVDYHDEDLGRTGFSIENPSAKSKCGCGSSFSM